MPLSVNIPFRTSNQPKKLRSPWQVLAANPFQNLSFQALFTREPAPGYFYQGLPQTSKTSSRTDDIFVVLNLFQDPNHFRTSSSMVSSIREHVLTRDPPQQSFSQGPHAFSLVYPLALREKSPNGFPSGYPIEDFGHDNVRTYPPNPSCR